MISKQIKTLLLYGLGIKIFIGVFLPMSPDEAYYWVWSHHLQLSYFDHPPFVSWLFLIGQPFESFESFVRLPSLIMSQGSLLLWALLLKDYLSEKQLFWWTLLAMAMPLVGPGGLIVTPDLPLMFFWPLTLLIFKKLLEVQTIKWALLAGLSLGLGMASKYTMVLILPVIFLWLFLEPIDLRKKINFIFMGILGAAVASSPVWIWNLTNDLKSIGFQLNHGFGGGFRPKYFLDYTLGQIGLIFPPVVYLAFKARKQCPLWLSFACIFPLIFFGFSSFFSYAEANWPIVAHPAALAMGVMGASKFRWAKWTFGIWITLLSLVIAEVFFSWIPQTGLRLKTDTMKKYNVAAQTIQNDENIFARTYQMASILSFKNQRQIYKLKGMNRIDFYDSLDGSIPQSKNFRLILKKNEALPAHLKEMYQLGERSPIDDNFEIVEVEKL